MFIPLLVMNLVNMAILRCSIIPLLYTQSALIKFLMLWCFVFLCVFLDLQLCKQLSQYCKDKLLLVALPLLKLYSWESASTDALSVSFSGDSLLVIFYLVCIFLTCTYFHKISPQVGKNTIWAQWKSFCCCCIFQDFHEAWNSTIKFYFH